MFVKKRPRYLKHNGSLLGQEILLAKWVKTINKTKVNKLFANI